MSRATVITHWSLTHNALQHTATHTATHCNTLQQRKSRPWQCLLQLHIRLRHCNNTLVSHSPPTTCLRVTGYLQIEAANKAMWHGTHVTCRDVEVLESRTMTHYVWVTNYLLVEAASRVVRTWVTKYHALCIYIYMSHELSAGGGSNSRTMTHYVYTYIYMSHELFAGGGSKSRSKNIGHEISPIM